MPQWKILCAPMMSVVIFEGVVGVALLVGGYFAPKIYCHFTECCRNKWIKPKITGLQSALRRRVFLDYFVPNVSKSQILCNAFD